MPVWRRLHGFYWRETESSVSMIRSMMVRCGAEFNFEDLAPGRYELALLPNDGKGDGDAIARQDAIITDSNLQKNFPMENATP